MLGVLPKERQAQRLPQSRIRVLVAVAVALALLSVVAILDPWRTTLVASGPLMPSTGLGIDDLAFGAVTSIGAGRGHVVLLGLIAMALVAARRAPDALFVIVAVLGASVVSRIAKNVFDAPRPPTVDQALYIPTTVPLAVIVGVLALSVIFGLLRGWGPRAFVALGTVLAVLFLQVVTNRLDPITRGLDAFPSGHATGSATLAAAAVIVAWSDRRWRWPVVIAAIAYAFAVGLSRVYLGVHYPADVVAGWALGTAWVITLWLVWSKIRERRGRRAVTSVEAVS
jgi:membrane-associated phospholipid phosphatase